MCQEEKKETHKGTWGDTKNNNKASIKQEKMPYALRRQNCCPAAQMNFRAKNWSMERTIAKATKKMKTLETALKKETVERKKQSRWSWYHWSMRKKLTKKVKMLETKNLVLESQVARLSEGATHPMTLRPRKKKV